MNKICVSLPDKLGRWKVQIGKSIVRRKTATSAYGRVERKLLNLSGSLASSMRDKTCVSVKDGQYVLNESINSANANYHLYCLTCFLEDFISERMLKDKTERYLRYSGGLIYAASTSHQRI